VEVLRHHASRSRRVQSTSIGKLDELDRASSISGRSLESSMSRRARASSSSGSPSGSATRWAGESGASLSISRRTVSPDFEQRPLARIPEAQMEILEMDGADYHPEPATFDLTSCMGGSWVFAATKERSDS